jgi:hypothetical protein
VNGVYCHTCPGRVGIDVDCDDVTHDHDPPGRVVTFCETCGGHIGFPGSLGELCVDETHDRHVERWSVDDERFWGKVYAREAHSRKMLADAETERLSTPLLERLRACGVRPASDGVMSIFTADTRDVHDAADVIETLLAVAARLAGGDEQVRADARAELAKIALHVTSVATPT